MQIIDDAVFDEAQKILEQRKYTNEKKTQLARTAKSSTMLGGNIYCAHCGKKLCANSFVDRYTTKDGTKENHQYITKAAYVVLGINLDGQKDILGIWIGENESSKFWLNVLNELKTRGIKDVFLFCVDGLTGFRQAIERYHL